MNRFSLLLLFGCLVLSVQASEIETFEAKVKKGDNAFTFLSRYKLSYHECNISLFKELNAIKDINTLYAGKIYILPVRLYRISGQNIQKVTKIKDKEALERIISYNKSIELAGIKPKEHVSSKVLWVPMDETKCNKSSNESQAEDVHSSSDKDDDDSLGKTETKLKRKGVASIEVPLMGKNYKTVHIEDYSLKGQVFYIISGHGGPDPGAVCKSSHSNLCEDEYAYDVSLRLARNLMQHGATVHMIVQDENDGVRDESYLDCDCDEKLMGDRDIPINQVKRLKDRVTLINKLYAKHKKKGVKVQKAIEIHVDSRNKSKRQDVFFYYNKYQKDGKALAQTVHNTFEAKYAKHQKNRGYHGHVEDRGLYMVRNTAPTMLFVELANITNPDDQKRLLINTNRQALANWLFEGLRKK
ncbi:MAG: N-acetylmuramoyl-L-alanine amidase [Saprospiraceae bacterium]